MRTVAFCLLAVMLPAAAQETRTAAPAPSKGALLKIPTDKNVLDVLRDAIDADVDLPPVRAITRGPKFHWFGYYDKLQVNPAGRYALSMEVDFEHRSPRADDVVRIGMVDLAEGDKWIELGESRAWNWQQGCMLQWRPGSRTEVLYNDRQDGKFICVILDVATRKRRILPHPVYHVSPDGKRALGADFARIQDLRPGYGYAGIPDKNKQVSAPDDSFIYLLNLDTGERKNLFSVADIVRRSYPDKPPAGKHYFNHIQWNTDGTRFLFYHRYRPAESERAAAGGGNPTRVFTAGADGRDVRLLSGRLGGSHDVWKDAGHVVMWTKEAYRLFADDGSDRSKVLLEAPNGHPSYVPGARWLVTDTYPFRGYGRMQYLYLLHEDGSRAVPLGRFHSPEDYTGEWRCDLHPRITPDGGYVLIDSPHGGALRPGSGQAGRQIYLVDIRRIAESLP